MTLTQTINSLVASLNGIPAAVSAATASLTTFIAFLNANI